MPLILRRYPARTSRRRARPPQPPRGSPGPSAAFTRARGVPFASMRNLWLAPYPRHSSRFGSTTGSLEHCAPPASRGAQAVRALVSAGRAAFRQVLSTSARDLSPPVRCRRSTSCHERIGGARPPLPLFLGLKLGKDGLAGESQGRCSVWGECHVNRFPSFLAIQEAECDCRNGGSVRSHRSLHRSCLRARRAPAAMSSSRTRSSKRISSTAPVTGSRSAPTGSRSISAATVIDGIGTGQGIRSHGNDKVHIERGTIREFGTGISLGRAPSFPGGAERGPASRNHPSAA